MQEEYNGTEDKAYLSVVYTDVERHGRSVVHGDIKTFWNELKKEYRLETPNYRGKNISEGRLNGIYGVDTKLNSMTYIERTRNHRKTCFELLNDI